MTIPQSQVGSIDREELKRLAIIAACAGTLDNARKGWATFFASIDAKVAQARENAIHEAAKVCDDIGQDYRGQYKGRGKYGPNNPHRADPYADGASDGAWQCEDAVIALLQPQHQESDTSGLPG